MSTEEQPVFWEFACTTGLLQLSGAPGEREDELRVPTKMELWERVISKGSLELVLETFVKLGSKYNIAEGEGENACTQKHPYEV